MIMPQVLLRHVAYVDDEYFDNPDYDDDTDDDTNNDTGDDTDDDIYTNKIIFTI